MNSWKLVATVLACLSTVKAFNCPDDSHSFYHADVSTGCQVYHLCQNSQLQTFTCPSGQAFNHANSRCEDASTVNCYETMGDHSHHHHHHKRAIEEYHTIDIQHLKNKVIEAYNSIKPILIETVESTAPSIYAKFEKDYLPALKNFKKEVLPFVREKMLPHIRKYFRLAVRVMAQSVEKLYKSYQMSNSTHINIVSFSDVATEVTNEIKPVLDLGRFLTAKVLKENEKVRNKRSTPDEEYGIEYVTRLFEKPIANIFYGNTTSLLTKLFMPIFYDMMENRQTRRDVLKVVISAKNAFKPVVFELLESEIYTSPEDAIIKLPRIVYTNAINQFLDESRDILKKIIERHVKDISQQVSDYVPTLIQSIERFEAGDYPQAQVLKKAVEKFFEKHGSLLQTSSEEHFKFYPVKEIFRDAVPIKNALHQIFMEYFNENEDSWLKFVFGNLVPTKKSTSKYAKPLIKESRKKSAY